jgi:fibronectin-binding autotransporter adhesin
MYINFPTEVLHMATPDPLSIPRVVRNFHGIVRLTAVVLGTFGVAGRPVTALAQATWDGGVDTLWSTGANWSGTPPVNSGTSALTFDGSSNLSNSNDLTSLTVSGLSFAAAAGEFTLGGSAVTLTGTVTNNTISGTQTIGLDITTAATRFVTGASGATTRLDGDVSGAGSLTITGDGHRVILGGSNSYSNTAGTTVNAAGGGLVLASANALPATDATFSPSLTIQAGSLSLAGSDARSGPVTLGGGAAGTTASIDTGAHTLTIQRRGTGQNQLIAYSGATANANGATIAGRILVETATNAAIGLSVTDSTAAAVDLTISADISAPATTGVSRSGAGTLVLSGSNSWAGNTSLSAGAGMTRLDSEFAVPGGLGFTGASFISLGSGAMLGLGASDLTRRLASSGANSIVLSGGGGFAAYGADRVVDLRNASDQRISIAGSPGTLFAATGPLILGAADATHAIDFRNPLALDLVSGFREVRVDSPAGIPQVMSGVISGVDTQEFRKTGTGTLLFSAANTFSGTTSVSAGTLLVNGTNTSASGHFSVQSGATLGGTGAIAGTVAVAAGGFLSPGASIESLAVGETTLATSSSFVYEVDSSAPLGVAADLLRVNGDLTLSGVVNLLFSDIAATPQGFADGTTFTLVNYTGDLAGVFSYDGVPLAEGSQFTAGGTTWQITYDGEGGGSNFPSDHELFASYVNIVAVPEPSGLLLGCGGLAAAAVWRRMRRRPAQRA